MNKVLISIVILISFFVFFISGVSATLLNPAEIGFNGQSRSINYNTLLDSLYANNNVVTTIGSDLWVPWFKTSSSSQLSDLQSGNNCNSGQTIDFTHNCMVTDEFSQVGVITAMGNNQARMDQFYNTVIASKSTNGNLPSWRIYRNGGTIEACKSGINGNCDTASDGSARIVISLLTASKNPLFTNTAQKSNYANLGVTLANDMLTYEVDHTCRPTNFGQVCNWLAGGSNVKKGGIYSTDYAYTGYYPDAIIAMLAAYASTNDTRYYNAAKDFTLNYMQAANFNGQTFTVPPGKSFRWNVDASGIPRAECTNTCAPAMWDSFDASRALGMCQANYYALQMNIQLPNLQQYCNLLGQKYMGNPSSAPLQFYPDGSAAGSYQSGYFAQGLEALHQSGVNAALFKSTVDSGLSHYTAGTRTFDNEPSLGVYTKAFVIRALGMGIGRDIAAFTSSATILPTTGIVTNTTNTTGTTSTNISNPLTNTSNATGTSNVATSNVSSSTGSSGTLLIQNLAATCTYGSNNCVKKTDATSGVCRTIVWSTSKGYIQMLGCYKDNGYVELYLQAAPKGLNFKACLANGCLTKDAGFARFIPIVSSTTATSNTATKNSTTTTNSTATNSTGSTNTSIKTTNVTSTNTTSTNSTTKTSSTVTSLLKLPIKTIPAGTIASDVMDGYTCEVITYSNPSIKVKICDKNSGNYEIYLVSTPNGSQLCAASSCVGTTSGFAAFRY